MREALENFIYPWDTTPVNLIYKYVLDPILKYSTFFLSLFISSGII
jgi:hypothetical protein